MNSFKRFTVVDIFIDQDNFIQSLNLDSDEKCELRGIWFETNIQKDDIIAIKTNLIKNKTYFLDDNNGMIIVDPDFLLTCTDISSANFCLRKTWLNSRFKPEGFSNKSFLIGDLVHELFQKTIKEKNLTKLDLLNELKNLIKQPFFLKYLLLINLSEDELLKDSIEYIDSVLLFRQKYVSGVPSLFDPNQPNSKLRVNKITDIEDSILEPKFGMKGKVDVTMNVEIYGKKGLIKHESTPVELKTGKVSFSISHQGQISLYVLMKDIEENPCKFGLLVYLKDGINIKYIEINEYVKKSLISQRNLLSFYFKSLENGPDTRQNISSCSKCDHLLDCCLIGKLYNPDKLANFDTNDPKFVPKTLEHLNDEYINFFYKWVDLVYLEEKLNKFDKSKTPFWNQKSIDLEKKDLAIAKLVLCNKDDINYEYTFRRASSYKSLGSLPTEILIYKGDNRIGLSIEKENDEIEKISFLIGTIKKIDENFVHLKLDGSIKSEFNSKIFRIDFIFIQQNYTYIYSSLLRLMSNDSCSKTLREIIIDKKKPTFRETLSSFETNLIDQNASGLNVIQKQSVIQSLKMNDYLLIKGNPGSGKTETIVKLIKVLACLNKSVFITAHTNSAVDNILCKLIKLDVKFMRIGNPSRIHPEIKNYSEEKLIESIKSTKELKKVYESYNIFAGTCISSNSHLIFSQKNFEICIVDEASQLILPENLLPLFYSKKFILVGDPMQLPPVVRSNQAKKAGLEESLFNLLMTKENSVELTIQYRMNNEIMRIANNCTYGNKLSCGSKQVAKATLNFDDQIDLDSDIEVEYDSTSWMDYCLSNKMIHSAIFLNTDGKNSLHLTDSNNEIYNTFEVNVVIKLLKQLEFKKISNSQIGIIAPYQRQVKELRCFLKTFNVEVSTIDQYQGRDKDIIIISCVKNEAKNFIDDNEILNDHRRLNVAMTRAKKKLIVIGSKTTLEKYEPFKIFFSALNPDQIIKV